MKTPRAFRPQKMLILAVAPLLADDAYLQMGEREFIGAVMKETGGSQSPDAILALYRDLISEAGTS